MNPVEYEKKGFLYTSYKLFHLKDSKMQEFANHYHDFNKVIFLISGNVTYFIEGKSYLLEPYDIVLIPRYAIHRPEVDFSIPYERYILYIDLLEGDNLASCFGQADKEVLRAGTKGQQDLFDTLRRLETSIGSHEFAEEEYSQSICRQLMIELNRLSKNGTAVFTGPVIYDRKLFEILEYINANLSQSLSVDSISEHLYISKYHLMRTFKKKTGYSIHNYIVLKRLFLIRELILKDGMNDSLAGISFRCGFQDYSTFFRKFKEQFGMSPEEYKKSVTAENRSK